MRLKSGSRKEWQTSDAEERAIMSAVLEGSRILRLTTFLDKILKPTTGLPILTPNFDRLIEVACEMAGFRMDTTAIGHYAGAFDHLPKLHGIMPGHHHPRQDYGPRPLPPCDRPEAAWEL
jgi:hypothetical protein